LPTLDRDTILFVVLPALFAIALLIFAMVFTVVWGYKLQKRIFLRAREQFGAPKPFAMQQLLSPEDRTSAGIKGLQVLGVVVTGSALAALIAYFVTEEESRDAWSVVQIAVPVVMIGVMTLAVMVRLWNFFSVRASVILALGRDPHCSDRFSMFIGFVVLSAGVVIAAADFIWSQAFPVWVDAIACVVCLAALKEMISQIVPAAVVDNGMLIDGLVVPWPQMRWYSWTYNHKALVVNYNAVLLLNGLSIFIVPSEVGNEVDRILQQNLPGKRRPDLPPPYDIPAESLLLEPLNREALTEGESGNPKP
jgi:hypothetical protein